MTTSFSLLGRSSILLLSACALGSTVGCNSKTTAGAGGTTGSTSSSGTTATSTTTTGTGSTSGTGGSVPTGPITGIPDSTWTWVDFPDSRCMNDTPTGIGVNFTSASKDVLIFLEGGNACFNTLSCALTYNPAGYGEMTPPASGTKQGNFQSDVTTFLSTATLFQRMAGNPLKDFNYIWVPYCTGDLHFGDTSGMVGGAMRNFHGYKNMQSFLKRITATFPTPGNVILSGVSAGGFGAALNYDQTAAAFGANVKVKLLDDSGPPMAMAFIPPCLQQAFASTWGFATTLPKGCTACSPTGVFTEPLASYLMTTYPDRALGLISSTQDGTISQFLGYGDNNCATITGVQAPGPYPGSEYAMGVADLRDRIGAGHPNFYTYYIDGTDGQDDTRHVWLDKPVGVSSNGVLLMDWLTKFVTGDPSLADVPAQMPAGG